MDRGLVRYLQQAVEGIRDWESESGPFDVHPATRVDSEDMEEALSELTERLRGNYPFFHPRYAGQMLKPPHPAAIAGYLAAVLINPNNHALDGGPPTSRMEKEAIRDLAAMVGFPENSLGHLTGGGTVANLEAIWVSREINPDKAVVYSSNAHYTHARMCALTGVAARCIGVNEKGELSLEDLEVELQKGDVGLVVATAGTTGAGIADDIPEIIRLCRAHDVRVHVDAAYGGFFRLLTEDDSLSRVTAARLSAISDCDSVVIDPHKHGLQPYGCGAVLFRDPTVGRFYKHDSPYTYFTSDELHLGEISLECSRPGAAAAALWLTLRLIPLEKDRGMGPILKACREAAITFSSEINSGELFQVLHRPELDIVTYFPAVERVSEVDRLSETLFRRLMNDRSDPVYLSLLTVEGSDLARHGVEEDAPRARILRSVFMKPEHEHAAWHLAQRIKSELERIGAQA